MRKTSFNLIVKIQRPLMSNDPNTGWLVYPRNRSWMMIIDEADVPSHVKREMGDRPKGYFLARKEGSEIKFGSLVQGEKW